MDERIVAYFLLRGTTYFCRCKRKPHTVPPPPTPQYRSVPSQQGISSGIDFEGAACIFHLRALFPALNLACSQLRLQRLFSHSLDSLHRVSSSSFHSLTALVRTFNGSLVSRCWRLVTVWITASSRRRGHKRVAPPFISSRVGCTLHAVHASGSHTARELCKSRVWTCIVW